MKLSELIRGDIFEYDGYVCMKLTDRVKGDDYRTTATMQAVVLQGPMKGYVHSHYYDIPVEVVTRNKECT